MYSKIAFIQNSGTGKQVCGGRSQCRSSLLRAGEGGCWLEGAEGASGVRGNVPVLMWVYAFGKTHWTVCWRWVYLGRHVIPATYWGWKISLFGKFKRWTSNVSVSFFSYSNFNSARRNVYTSDWLGEGPQRKRDYKRRVHICPCFATSGETYSCACTRLCGGREKETTPFRLPPRAPVPHIALYAHDSKQTFAKFWLSLCR